MGPVTLSILLFFIFVYISIGIFIFITMEAKNEIRRQEEILDRLQAFLDQYRCLDRGMLMEVLDFIDRDLDTARHVLRHNDTFNVMWDTTGAASFVISVITTIGYGHITPRTDGGKVTCMLYAIIGIPLLLVFLKGAGELLWKLCRRCLHASKSCCTGRSSLLHRVNACFHSVLGLSLLFVFPCTMNVYLEKWSTLDAIYSCFITLTTIGFGDFVAGNPADRQTMEPSSEMRIYRIVNLLWTLLGLAYISMIITAISNYYISKTQGVRMKAQGRMEKLRLRLARKLNCNVTSCNSSTQTEAPSLSIKISPNLQPLSEDVASDVDVQLVAFSQVPAKSSSRASIPSTIPVAESSAVSQGTTDSRSAKAVTLSGGGGGDDDEVTESAVPERTAQQWSSESGDLPDSVSQTSEVLNDRNEVARL